MKSMDRLYERLTPVERFKIAIAAFGREDLAEVYRRNGSAPYRSVREQEPAYFERLLRLSLLASYLSVEVRDVQLKAAILFCATTVMRRRAVRQATQPLWNPPRRAAQQLKS